MSYHTKGKNPLEAPVEKISAKTSASRKKGKNSRLVARKKRPYAEKRITAFEGVSFS